MYNVSEEVINSILNKKFNAMVGNLCEKLEEVVKLMKFELKKDAYNTMREIKDQVNCFSKGTKISVNLIKPTSDQ
jgi:hypothetical protein